MLKGWMLKGWILDLLESWERWGSRWAGWCWGDERVAEAEATSICKKAGTTSIFM
jgi:hypothetical protein